MQTKLNMGAGKPLHVMAKVILFPIYVLLMFLIISIKISVENLQNVNLPEMFSYFKSTLALFTPLYQVDHLTNLIHSKIDLPYLKLWR